MELIKDNIIKEFELSEDSENESINNEESFDTNNEDIPDINEMILTSKEKYYFRMVDKYFRNLDQKKIIKMLDIIEGRSKISLRLLDWFVTKYASKKKINYIIQDTNLENNIFNVHISYKAQLKSYKKRYFDPFRRNSLKKKKKFLYNYDISDKSKKFITTIGQLNFFRWIFSNNIIDYVENNYDIISKAMVQSNKDDKLKKLNDNKSNDSKESITINKYGVNINAEKNIKKETSEVKIIVSFD